MDDNKYAVVAYLPGELAAFVHELRHRFNPALAGWLPHVTLLPPRPLQLPTNGASHSMRRQIGSLAPFDAAIRGAATFWPVSGVVYLSFAAGSEQLIDLHGVLNQGELAQDEIHPYVPHVTIAQDLDELDTRKVLGDVAAEWSLYRADAFFRIESLVLVQHTPDNRWLDLASVELGHLTTPTR